MFFSKNQENLFLKVLGLFSIVRGYNILILIIAQYLTARYVFSPKSNCFVTFKVARFCFTNTE